MFRVASLLFLSMCILHCRLTDHNNYYKGTHLTSKINGKFLIDSRVLTAFTCVEVLCLSTPYPIIAEK